MQLQLKKKIKSHYKIFYNEQSDGYIKMAFLKPCAGFFGSLFYWGSQSTTPTITETPLLC